MAISKESDIDNKEKKILVELKEKERILQEELEYRLWKEEEEREFQETIRKSAEEMTQKNNQAIEYNE